MKFSLGFVCLGLFALALSASVHHGKVADKEFLYKQKVVFDLFKYINHDYHFDEKTFDLNAYKSKFTKPEVFDHFYDYFHYDYFLPKGEIFSVFNYDHVQQVKVLFNMFYYAHDFETFYKFAQFARYHFNEGMFLYTFSVALIHRPDTYGIVLPPIYEIYPYYFFSSEVIHKAQHYKQVYYEHPEQKEEYKIYANYTGWYINAHPEQSLSYFHEDIGLNTFYYYFNLYYPYWMSAEEYHFVNDKRGEFYYYFYQQFLARYYLERLSNDFGEIPYFNWDVPFETQYYPSLYYHNGLEFPSRPQFANLYEYFYNYGQKSAGVHGYGHSHLTVTEYESRIYEAIDKGYVFDKSGTKYDLYSKDGFNVLGNLIQGNPDSVHQHYYGSLQFFARHLLGYSTQPYDYHHTWPSALEHFETSLRDPAFYQLYKKIVFYFLQYKWYLPSYTKQELYYPGVSVEKVEFDRLVTYFDYFKSEISAATYVTDDEYEHDKFKVYAYQQRLNHKPFNYNIYVKSDKPQKAVVKIFMGPKYDEYGRYINISQNNYNFVEFDHFVYDLGAGETVIKRNSHENQFFSPDYKSFWDMYKQVNAAYKGQGEFHIDGYHSYFYFPQRFMLPIGKEHGFPYQFFVYVYPYVEYKDHVESFGEYGHPKINSAYYHFDNHPLGYPFDRFIKYEKLWYDMPNGYFYEAKVYHKSIYEIQGTH